MRRSRLLLFSLAFLLPATRTAANVCPWVTKGSAEAALGGSVSLTVKISDSGEGFCTFYREQGASKQTLKILVQKNAPPSCPEGSPKLKGIGNEAVQCTVRRSPEESVEMIVSRVRELNFTVSLTTHRPAVKNSEASGLASAVEQVAEQVAGNLF